MCLYVLCRWAVSCSSFLMHTVWQQCSEDVVKCIECCVFSRLQVLFLLQAFGLEGF